MALVVEALPTETGGRCVSFRIAYRTVACRMARILHASPHPDWWLACPGSHGQSPGKGALKA